MATKEQRRLTTKIRENRNANKNKLSGYFKRQTDEIVLKKNWMWLPKENHMNESEFLLIAAQNNAITTHYNKEKINTIQQKSKSRLCEETNKTVNNKS